MAYDRQDFMGKLRENKVFPEEGKGLPDPLIGMPDFYSGRQVPPYGNYSGHGGGGMGPEYGLLAPAGVDPLMKPYGDFLEKQKREKEALFLKPQMAPAKSSGMAEEFTNNILNPPERGGKFQLELLKESNKVDNNKANIGLKSRAQDLREKIESNRATDAEKHEYAMELLGIKGGQAIDLQNLRGTQQEGLLDKRGTQAIDLQNLRGTQQTGLQELRGNQALDQIGARGEVKKETQLSPSQERNQTNNNVNRMLVDEPELAKFLVRDPNTNQYTISPEADPKIRSMISQRLFGRPNSGDISLPSGPKKNTTPTSTTPTVAPPKSKYSVTVNAPK